MNDDVRIYLVDEYCAGASHFCFSERKDVVLLEDYEKLRAENERLKAERNCAIMSRDMAWDENELLNDALKDKSQEHAEIEAKHIERINTCTATIKKLRKENKKLKCLALLLASEMYWFKYLCNKYEGSDWWAKMKRQSVYYRKAYRKAKKALKEGK